MAQWLSEARRQGNHKQDHDIIEMSQWAHLIKNTVIKQSKWPNGDLKPEDKGNINKTMASVKYHSEYI